MKNTPKFNKGDKIANGWEWKNYKNPPQTYRIKRVVGNVYVMYNQYGTKVKKSADMIDNFYINVPFTPEEIIDQLLAKYK